jgi:two-component system phosphate regulon sensor histidine kinase PhoR
MRTARNSIFTGIRTDAGSLLGSSPSRGALIVALAAIVFAGAFAMRLAIENPGDAVLYLFVLPVALVALEWGARGGIVAAAFALAFFVLWEQVEDVEVGVADYLARAAAFFPIGVLVGVVAGRLRAAVEASRDAERRTREIVETAHDAFISMGSDGVITGWNPAAESTFGWTASEAIGKTVAETIIPEGMHEAHWRGLRRFLATGEGPVIGRRIELSGLHRDRHEIPVELTISAVPEGEGWSFHAFLHDISDRKRTEMVRQEAERIKDEFFALVSHELRTPLTSIIGYTELLAEIESERLSDQGRRFLEVVERNARRELRLVADLLLLVRVEAGTFTVEPGVVDLREVLEQSAVAARPRAEERNLTLSLELEPVPDCEGDAHRLSQVAENLLSNAIKFTPEGGRVAVRLSRRDGSAVIEVEDSGVGIPYSEQGRLFERLYRASSATSRQIPGIGLGLTIVKAIVDAHGGRIEVESEEGVGTTFRMELPLRSPPRDRALASTEPGAKAEGDAS